MESGRRIPTWMLRHLGFTGIRVEPALRAGATSPTNLLLRTREELALMVETALNTPPLSLVLSVLSVLKSEVVPMQLTVLRWRVESVATVTLAVQSAAVLSSLMEPRRSLGLSPAPASLL